MISGTSEGTGVGSGDLVEAGEGLRMVLVHQHQAPDDDQVAALLQDHFSRAGHRMFVDRTAAGNIDWGKRMLSEIEQADVVVPLLSAESMLDEVLAFEVERARDVAQVRKGRPIIIPVRIRYEGPLTEALRPILDPLGYQLWEGPESNLGLLTELEAMLHRLPDWVPMPNARSPHGEERPLADAVKAEHARLLEPPGGAVPLGSRFYLTRGVDHELQHAVERFDSIVLIKGARQMGKTSLLARGLQAARDKGARVAMTDFQEFGSSNLENTTTLYLSLAESLVDRLGMDLAPSEIWDVRRGANVNFDRFMRREVLAKINGPLVWGLDEVDRLLVTDYASEVFGLFRSWHNQRALDPSGPWSALTLVIAYATEAALFIRDINQSPFNVGTRLALEDFSREQVIELNERYGTPLRTRDDLERFWRLVSGHPFLVRRGLHEITTRKLEIGVFEAKASADEGIFADHLRRILMLLARDTELMEVVRENLLGMPCNNTEAFFRLRSAGVMSGVSAGDMKPRCHIYSNFLRRHLLVP